MPIARLDHVSVCTTDMPRALAFYRDVVGLEPGPRPDFSFAGAWLYAGDAPVLHLIARTAPATTGVLDHACFAATGLASYIATLRRVGLAYDLRRMPPGVPQSGTHQLFFHDPDGARIELSFSPDETSEG